MGLKINHIIVLENKKEYIVLNEAMYYGKKYFLAMELDENREVISKSVAIIEEEIDGFDTYIKFVKDSKLIPVLTRIFKAQTKNA